MFSMTMNHQDYYRFPLSNKLSITQNKIHRMARFTFPSKFTIVFILSGWIVLQVLYYGFSFLQLQVISDNKSQEHSYLTPDIIKKLEENSCQIPIMNPFSPELVKFFQPFKITCKKKEYYFRSQIDQSSDEPVILMEKRIPQTLSCCYEHLRFSKLSNYYRQNPLNETCSLITNKVTPLPPDSQYIIINCWNTSTQINSSDSIAKLINFDQTNKKITPPIVHHELLFYIPKPKIYRKIRFKQKLNIIILGFDKVSRLNFIRLMGKTFRYLKSDLKAIDLQGFNKMGDATLNNTLGYLTGHDYGQIIANPKWWKGTNNDKYFDDCPWIWEKFSKRGYITVYGDDYDSVFDYRFNGFRKQPTDYYLQPFSYWYRSWSRATKFGEGDCIGNKPALHLLNELTRKVSYSLRNHTYFSFMWNSRIHERSGYPSMADEDTLETLKYLEKTGELNQSLVVLISDHGWRTGSVVTLEQGKLENRMPFAFLLLPKWFREKYSEAYENLLENQYRLTTPYDVHATLVDVLNYLENEEGRSKRIEIDGYGVSLLNRIPKNRSCEEAGIDETWCACSAYNNFSINSSPAIQLAKYAISTINSWLKPYKVCHEYELEKVLSAEVKVDSDSNFFYNGRKSDETPLILEPKGNQTFRISFSVKRTPKFEGPRFEVTIFTEQDYWKYNEQSQSKIRMSSEVFRLNNYGISADCMKHVYFLIKLCTCK